MTRLVALCRAGFEAECAAELEARARAVPLALSAAGQPGAAWVAVTGPPEAVRRLAASLDLRDLVFARQWFLEVAALEGLEPGDRLGPVAQALRAAGTPVEALVVECPDSREGRELSGLARRLAGPLHGTLQEAGLLGPAGAGVRLHLLLRSGRSASVGVVDPARASPWPGGIPRLRFPRGAPSRSALKLEEAFATFLDPDTAKARLRPGLRAVDLGASPGGWTWVLAARGLRVIAVDNGPLAPRVLEAGAVEHRREDGFRYRPRRAVEWLTCDIADKPLRVAALIADWLEAGLARQAVFNLKLPMRRRFETVERCRERIGRALDRAPGRWRLRLRQLYHDREEVTGFAERL